MRTFAAAALLCIGSLAAGQEYSVDDRGGPLTLTEDLARAATAWNSLSEEAQLEQAAVAATTFSFADPDLLGPDVASATLVREDEAGFEVWLNPRSYRNHPQVLLHELGLLLGLPSGETGVMDPALSDEGPETPTDADLQALASVQGRAGGDIDGDGDTDLADLAALGRAYGQRGVNLSADLDGDGVVGASDVELLRENYTFTTPAVPAEDDAGVGGDDDRAEEDDAGVNDFEDAGESENEE